MREREFEVGEHMLKQKCLVCRKHFKLKEKIVLVPIQEPKGDYYINAMAIPLHVGCHYKERD